jgi:pre-mRNA-processing factor 6
MMGGQIYSQDFAEKKKAHLDRARKVYQEGIEQCPDNVTLWILASQLEEQAHTFADQDSKAGAGVTKARSLLELARLKVPKNDELWLEAVRLERRSNNGKLAETLMARALQECPRSGRLLAESILTAPRIEQKGKSADAIKRNPESPLVIAAVATLFASDRKTDKARKWFERAVLLDTDLGDSWGRYYAFELESGTPTQQADVKERCVRAEPKHGEVWQSIMKDVKNLHKTVGEGIELVAAEIKKRQQSGVGGR